MCLASHTRLQFLNQQYYEPHTNTQPRQKQLNSRCAYKRSPLTRHHPHPHIHHHPHLRNAGYQALADHLAPRLSLPHQTSPIYPVKRKAAHASPLRGSPSEVPRAIKLRDPEHLQHPTFQRHVTVDAPRDLTRGGSCIGAFRRLRR